MAGKRTRAYFVAIRDKGSDIVSPKKAFHDKFFFNIDDAFDFRIQIIKEIEGRQLIVNPRNIHIFQVEMEVMQDVTDEIIDIMHKRSVSVV